ncbi:TonB-dependent receptor family protein [Lentisalinibacter sediminis]|uniref:TonB-dependent receptor family protein n=1 Tax=Lentisalinibacter sediminis TaxID=2992237 RepID=UPI00386EA898
MARMTSSKHAGGAVGGALAPIHFFKSGLKALLQGAIGAVIPLALIATPAIAQETTDEGEVIDVVTILGNPNQVSDIAGSAKYFSPEDLEVFANADIMRVLRAAPGVYLQEEEGYGLRPNIGIRGSGLDRSGRIALLEDGVLIAPAPYSAPSAYYFPTQQRMHALEVLKGPSSIGVGARTIGGAINMISTPIPSATGGRLEVRAGEDTTLQGIARYGYRAERYGWLLETAQQYTDGFKTIDAPRDFDAGYRLQDYMAKFRVNSAPGSDLYQSLDLKLGYTEQASDETYLGLTDEDFAEDPYRRYAASQNDVIDTNHRQVQLSWTIDPTGPWYGEVTAYRNDFERNWYKLSSVNDIGISSILSDPGTYAAELAILEGATSADDALEKRNNNREYYSQGLQARVGYDWAVGGADIGLTFGLRIHEDEEDRFQDDDGYRMEDGLLVLTTDAEPGTATNRVSTAEVLAGFVNAEISVGDWVLSPGFRYETIDLVREDYSTDNTDRSIGPTRVRENSVDVFIPGMGALYHIGENWRLLAGVHRGFNPPGPGSTADEEESWNYEFGVRWGENGRSFEAIGFVNDYENLVGTVTASTGGSGNIGDQFDGGEATVSGLELTGAWNLYEPFGNRLGNGIQMPLSLAYTWTATAEFDNSFESGFDPWGEVEAGDELPYIPEHQLRATAGLAAERWSLDIAASYTDETRTTAGSGDLGPREGVDSFVIWDLAAGWQVRPDLRATFRVDNLFDKEYAVARRPAGLRPGRSRTAFIGFTWDI